MISLALLLHAAGGAQIEPRVAAVAAIGGAIAVAAIWAPAPQAISGVRTRARLPQPSIVWPIGGSVLIGAGLFQFSDLKDRCLSECRNPGAFLMKHYRRGAAEAFRIGRTHGLFCLGCCWALMLVAFAVGVANLAWMAVLTL